MPMIPPLWLRAVTDRTLAVTPALDPELHALLADGPVTDDRALLRLAGELAALHDHPAPRKDRP